jgi:hypothetical protein
MTERRRVKSEAWYYNNFLDISLVHAWESFGNLTDYHEDFRYSLLIDMEFPEVLKCFRRELFPAAIHIREP